jgi:hypothetical protein
MSDDAPIPSDAWPPEFRPFESNATPAKDRAEYERLHDQKRASKSVPRPDKPDNRTNGRKASSTNEKVVRVATRTTPGQTPALAREENILDLFAADFRRAGVVGEERLAKLLYLSLTSRMLPWRPAAAVRPVSVGVKGTTSTGKSHATQTVLRFFPLSAYYNVGSFSRRYLFYTAESFEHRFLAVPEWASIKDDEEIVAMLRVLLSEGRIVHGTVEGDGGKREARPITKEGPTGLIVTTTDAAIDAEMETRLLSIVTDDTPEQTRHVFHKIAASQKGAGTLDLERWHGLQDWISEQGEKAVYVPFAEALADLIPANATRLRRDFGALLNLVRAHAILHQANRDRDGDGDLIATVEGDYAPVRLLVGDVIAESVEATVTAALRETVEAVQELLDDGSEHVSAKALVSHLGVGRSAAYDRIRRALFSGYLVNEAGRSERGYKLTIGAPLPGDEAFLPSPADVVRSLSGTPTGQTNPHEQRETGVLSGSPVRPADPQEERAPTLGDEMFPVLLAEAVRDGHITETEAKERYALHKAVVGT